jgi:hypothetical protein
MKKHNSFMMMVAISLVLMSSFVSAGTTVIGFEMGNATRASINDKFEDLGINATKGPEFAFTTGDSIIIKGDPFGISGLTETCLAFDENDNLGFVGMLMDPGRFDDMDKILEGKYSFLERHAREDGSRCSHYESEDTLIDLIYDAGYPLQVIYIRKG